MAAEKALISALMKRKPASITGNSSRGHNSANSMEKPPRSATRMMLRILGSTGPGSRPRLVSESNMVRVLHPAGKKRAYLPDGTVQTRCKSHPPGWPLERSVQGGAARRRREPKRQASEAGDQGTLEITGIDRLVKQPAFHLLRLDQPLWGSVPGHHQTGDADMGAVLPDQFDHLGARRPVRQTIIGEYKVESRCLSFRQETHDLLKRCGTHHTHSPVFEQHFQGGQNGMVVIHHQDGATDQDAILPLLGNAPRLFRRLY